MKHIAKILIFILTAGIALQASAAYKYKTTRTGLVVYRDSLDQVWAMAPFKAPVGSGKWYSDAINLCADSLAGKVRVYSMIAPTSAAFYLPYATLTASSQQQPVIKGMYRYLSHRVKPVDAYSELRRHVHEHIYARTDHHWLPLGAYYAAQAFARTAGVSFLPLADYDTVVVHRFVGSMYHYTHDPAVKASPEDFVYYTPRTVQYTTTYWLHRLNSRHKVIGVDDATQGNFFFHYKDGSGAAYCTFMGGDTRTTHVHTSTPGSRRLLIMKDSFGNAVAGFLMGSFSDIYVLDYRYMQGSLIKYIRDHGITDVLFINNLEHAYSKSTALALTRLIQQQ